MQIAVLGGGHGAYAAAADLSEQGHAVRLWRRDAAALAPLVANPQLTLKDHAGSRRVTLHLVTPDIGRAVRGAQVVLVPGPATAQDDIARAMAPHLQDGQVVLMPPGSFGSYAMARIARDAGSQADVAWAESGTLPYLTRKHGVDEVAITVRAVRLPTGVFPLRKMAQALPLLQMVYPSIQPCGDGLSGALMNAGPIIHPPLIVMNAAPLQHFERWDIHNEGTQPHVRAVTDALDAERVAVREKLGYGAPHFPLRDNYSGDQWMYGDAHSKLTDSGDWRERIDLHKHRYLNEDVAYGLALLCSVARWSGTPAPVAHGLLAVAGAMVGRDLTRGPRTLESLKLTDMGPPDLRRLLDEGL